nr:hypothetical protein [Lachnospiraceae bacterium]
MALKALKCPNCEANIQVDDKRDFGFCSYCGTQVQVREVVEVRYSGSVEAADGEYIKKLEAGKAFHKIGDFYKAEMIYMEMLREYPGRAEVYEGLICTITRNYTLFISENMERAYTLMDKMVLVASDDEKQHYTELREKVIGWFNEGVMKQARENELAEIARLNKMIRENIVIAIAAFVFAFAMLGLAKGDYVLSRLGLLACIAAVWSLVMFIKNGQKRDALMKKNNQMNDDSTL